MLAVFGCIWPVIYYFILKRINAKRAAMDESEIRARYTEEELSEMGDMSPLFRYATWTPTFAQDQTGSEDFIKANDDAQKYFSPMVNGLVPPS